jgi:transglutaminase-like putative cysteine protease
MVGMLLYALPAMLSLPPGPRPGLEELMIDEAAARLRASGLEGWPLVGAARLLVGERMVYCRRNSLDPASKAFRRGYGYCQQEAFALRSLLRALGFEAEVVQALHNRFPSGAMSGHAWVEVTYQGQQRPVDPRYQDPEDGSLQFKTLSPVTRMPPVFRVFAGWGAAAINAYRYYRTGSDTAAGY